MHKIHIVSRCKGKSLLNSRRIIDKYAQRISDKTWNCEISEYGLKNMILHMKSKARKNTAIAIYHIKENTNNLLCIIGKREMFGEDGSSPISVSSKNLIEENRNFINIPIYKQIAEFIGYAHDVGKINPYFQAKLKKKNVQDYIRHEYLSGLFFLAMPEYNQINIKENTIEYIELLIKNVSRLIDSIKNENEMFASRLHKDIVSKEYSKNEQMLFYLITTHHKVYSFEGGQITSRFSIKEFDKFNLVDFEKKLKALSVKSLGFILSAFSKKKYELLNYLSSVNFEISMNDFIYLRKSLMLADHFYSSKESSKKYTSKEPMAKSLDYGNQSLKEHLAGVSKMSRYVCGELISLERKMPKIYKNELADVLLQSRGKFSWQNNSAKSLESISSLNNNPNFVLLNADVGKGKTKTAFRLATLMSKDKGLRLNVALGLRTLTVQTSKSYEEALDIAKSNLETLIGDTDSIELDEKIKKKLEEKENLSMDNDIVEDDFIEVENNNEWENIPEFLKVQVKSKKSQSLLMTPIVVSTIDYLVKATDWRKSKHLLPSLRLMTSDLIIDEVDMYNTEDMKTIMRLVYICGYFKRNIILSTATPYSSMVFTLIESFKKGVEASSRIYSLDGKNKVDFNLHYLSDLTNDSFEFESMANSKERYEKYIKKSHKYMEPGKRKYLVYKNESNGFEDYYKCIELLHSNQHEIIDIDDNQIEYSIGLVRVERTKDGFNLLKTLLDNIEELNKDGVYLNTMFYHSRLLLSVRGYIENLLDDSLNRKKHENPITTEIFKRTYERINDKPSIKKIINIVIATSIEEVGRDHDFNYLICNAESVRTIIQPAGRVMRHRENFNKKANVVIMNKNNSFFNERTSGNSLLKNKELLSLIKQEVNEREEFVEVELSNLNILDSETLHFSKLENIVLQDALGEYSNNIIEGFNTNCSYQASTRFYTEWRDGGEDVNNYVYDFTNDTILIHDKETNKYVEIYKGRLPENNYDKKANLIVSRDDVERFILELELTETTTRKYMKFQGYLKPEEKLNILFGYV